MVDIATAPQDSGTRTNSWATLAALSFAGLVASVQQTLVLPLLPGLMRTFHASMTSVTWVFTASLLAGAVATPLLARFGDMYGKKKMILATIGLLVAGSMVCALSGSLARAHRRPGAAGHVGGTDPAGHRRSSATPSPASGSRRPSASSAPPWARAAPSA